VTYWTLAFNKLRVGYGRQPTWQRAAGTNILYQSAWTSDPAQLANDVFSYAIVTLPNGASLQDFFNRVSEGYYQYQQSGDINSEERHRIECALAVHCVGWSGYICNSANWHRTAWQKKPAAYTAKAYFGQNTPPGTPQDNTEHFERAEDMTVTAASKISWGTSGDSFKFVRLDAAGSTICKTLAFPSTGYYKVHAAVRASSTAHDQVWVRIGPPGVEIPWDVTNTSYGSWIWSHNGPQFSVTAGLREVCLTRYSGEQLEIDAILVRKE
jgi:hypothetical protein